MAQPLAVLVLSIITMVVVPLRSNDATDVGTGRKIGLFLWQSVIAVFMIGFAALLCTAMISTGVALAMLAALALLLPLFALEIFANLRSKYMTCAKVLLFPCLLAGAIWYTNYREDKVMTLEEYYENSISSYTYEKESEAFHFGEQATLRLTEDFPVIEGSTSLGALIKSLPPAVYVRRDPFHDWHRQYARVTKTPAAYANLIAGECDIIFAFHPSPAQLESAEKAGRPLRPTPVGREAFVFFVNPRNPVQEVSVDQLRGIYSGRIANWRDVGGPDETIIPFQRRKDSGSQSRMERFMAGSELMEPVREHRIWDMGGIVSQVSRYHNYRSAIGYSFLFYIRHMTRDGVVRMLRVDGAEPTLAAIRDGSYPLTDEIYAVTTDHSTPNTRLLIDWLLTPQGQRFVTAAGFAPAD